MDSINFVKGYNKVNHPHGHGHDNQSPRKRRTISAVIGTVSAISAILIIGFMVAVIMRHESSTNTRPPASPSLSLNSTASIKTVCSVTKYPDSCFTSISSLNLSNNSDPEIIFKLSLQVSIKELSNLTSFLKSLNGVHSEPALQDCMSQFEDALTRLNDTVSEMEVGSGEKMLMERKISDMQTWISGAMTDEDTCLDGLEEMGSKVFDEMKTKMQKSKELLSNSLAIIANIQTLLQKVGLTMH
ncbi:putative pectinesterase/pectinesterase inhibitor 26 [Mangifera indica]|uniref:putative pectinesterase/pectinesterase inhibitor 26 n=1 Tax=Mangifera indica TaxID=29780 RepID=UPI001CFB078C|nr:putative pectinesterase/pectinesterase inhibitor 26 [Mangifera indica]